MNFNLHFGELHSDDSINEKKKCLKIIFPNVIKSKEFYNPSIVFLSMYCDMVCDLAKAIDMVLQFITKFAHNSLVSKTLLNK